MEQTQEHSILGTTPINKLLIRMSIPMMISFLIQALYNIVDGMFVARISEEALTAVSLAFPIQQIIIAITVGTGIGVMTVVTRLNGQKDYARANKAICVSAFFILIYTVVFIILGLTVVRPFFESQTDNTQIVDMAVEYTTICMVLAVGNFAGGIFEKLLVGYGYSIASMISLASGAVINIVFDPLLIFGIGPFPKMGIAGAATATVFGQIVSGIVSYVLLKVKVKSIRFNPRTMLPDKFSLVNIFAVAIPSMITVGLSAIMTFGMNKILLTFSTTATAVFGIWMKVMNFAYMPIYGLNNAVLPIVSFNFGTGVRERVKEVLKLARQYAVVIEVVAILMVELIPGILMEMFDASPEMLEMGKTALRLSAPSLLFGAQNHVIVSSFQGLKHNSLTVVNAVARQIVFLLPVAYLLSLSRDLTAVWPSLIFAEILGYIYTLIMKKKVNRNLGEEWI